MTRRLVHPGYIGQPATLYSLDVPGTQGCLREPIEGGYYAVLWECDHAHRTDDAALSCAKREYARRLKARPSVPIQGADE